MRRTSAHCSSLILIAAAALAAPASAQEWRSPIWESPSRSAQPLLRLSPSASGDLIEESESNNTLATADSAELDDKLSGVIAFRGDVDWFGIDLLEGTLIDFAVDAQAHGSPLNSLAVLVDESGTQVAFSNDASGTDSRLRASVPATGRYFVGITDLFGLGHESFTYFVDLGVRQPGPGDPTTTRPSGADIAWTILADATGGAYVLDWGDGDVWHVQPSGETRLVAPGNGYDMALDGFEQLLVVEPPDSAVARIDPATGARSIFATLPGYIPTAIAIGPDGDVWVSGYRSEGARLFRLTPYGRTRASFALPGSALKMAFSPRGALHLCNGVRAIWRLERDGSVRTVIESTYGLGGMTFDAVGSIYLSTVQGGLLKYSATYNLLQEPFASMNLTRSGNTAFLRSATGEMTSRLVATNLDGPTQLAGRIVEMNAAGIPIPGFRVGADVERITVSAEDAARALFDQTILTAEQQSYLDAQGNVNGRIDVGDLRALVTTAAD